MGITTVADILRTHAAERPAETCLVEGARTRTWTELSDRSSRVAQAMRAAGVGVQDRVAFLDKNCIEHFEAGATLASRPTRTGSTGTRPRIPAKTPSAPTSPSSSTPRGPRGGPRA
jgi:non-ribosomal peptide synthetase component F